MAKIFQHQRRLSGHLRKHRGGGAMTARKDVWSADTQVSRPDPVDTLNYPVLVEMGGFAMTAGGLVHNLSRDDSEEIFAPTYAPEGFHG